MRKKVLIAALIIFTGLTAAQQSVTPGENNTIDQGVNDSIIGSSPLQASMQNQSVVVAPDLGFPAGQVSQRVEFSNSTREYDLVIDEYADWNISPTNLSKDLEVGESGNLQELSIDSESNTDFSLNIETSGDLFDFISVSNEVNLLQGVDRDLGINYQIRENADPGSYNGTITAEGMNETEEIFLDFTLVDNIDPEISNVTVEDYEATSEHNFTVTASDNDDIDEVRMSVSELVERNGSTVEEPFSDFRFEEVPNSDLYRLDISDLDDPGRYNSTITVVDNSGNTANTTESFTVRPLDAVNLESRVDLPVYRMGETVEKDIGVVEQDTSLELTLDSFSEEIGDEWDVTVLSDSQGPQSFSSVNDSVEFSEAANLSLRIEGMSETDYNGLIEAEGVSQHVSIDPVRFSGEFLDCPVPQRAEYEVLNRNITLEPVDSESCEDAGWEISYFASASTVESNNDLGSSVSIVTPNELKAQQRRIQNQVIDKKESAITMWKLISLLFVTGTGLSAYAAAFAVYQKPYMLHYDISRAESRRKRMSRRINLGLEEE